MVALKKSPGKLISIGFLSLGIFILMQIILPVVSFQIWAFGQGLNNQILVSPKDFDQGVLGVSIESKNNFPAIISLLTRETKPNYGKFFLSIPVLKINKADVFVDMNDLSASLAHLPGSALPGEKGNVFISGHSALSQLFSKQTIFFSKLPDLKKGNQIILETPSAKFIYEVVGFKIVDPVNLSVLTAPEENGRYLSLMTCVPPGLNFKRLIVLAKMI